MGRDPRKKPRFSDFFGFNERDSPFLYLSEKLSLIAPKVGLLDFHVDPSGVKSECFTYLLGKCCGEGVVGKLYKGVLYAEDRKEHEVREGTLTIYGKCEKRKKYSVKFLEAGR